MNSTTPFALNFNAARRASRIAKVREACSAIGSGLDSARASVLTPKELRFLEAKRAAIRPPRFYAVHCAHDKPMWMPCSASTCRRGKREAAVNWEKLVNGKL